MKLLEHLVCSPLSRALCVAALLLVAAGAHAAGKAPLEIRVFAGIEPALYPNSVLIMGEKDAVLVDGQWWLSEGRKVADWIAQSGRKLTTILITHAHPDHYTGLNAVVERFPDARVLARKYVRDVIYYEYPAKLMHWQELAGAAQEMPSQPVVPEVFEGKSIRLEGQEIRFVDLPPAETLQATAYYVPSAKTLIAGDLMFNRSHGYFGDLNNPPAWLDALEFARKIGPIETIVPGHGTAGGPEIIDSMIAYINAYREVAVPGARVATVAREMTRRYPDYPGALMLWLTRGPGFGLAGAAEMGVPQELRPPPNPAPTP
jgi:glyoxylase-like metal-dependent hydrolase (beta-lactamase superfamily II)